MQDQFAAEPGGTEEDRQIASEARGALDYTEFDLLSAMGLRPRQRLRRLRRLARRSVRPAVYLTTAAAIFAGGWFSNTTFRDNPAPAPVAMQHSSGQADPLVALLLPEKGVTVEARWGDLAKRLADAGVIDLQKFRTAAERAGSPLTREQLRLLDGTSSETMKMDSKSAYFQLDVLWALGLANKNSILTEGPMAQQGWDKAGSYASTGGWTLGKQPGPAHLATLALIKLTPQQQAVVQDVAMNAYRPCCGNMTAFPDCNHGMAALGLTELMASQGASAEDIFKTLKGIMPFWYPTQYHHLAMFFQGQGQKWQNVNARELLGKQYSSNRGYAQVATFLQQQGGGTTGAPGGKASGCSP